MPTLYRMSGGEVPRRFIRLSRRPGADMLHTALRPNGLCCDTAEPAWNTLQILRESPLIHVAQR
jgi:hypothetical protein